VAPRTQTEQAIAAVWAEVLKLDRVGIHDNFFELGGHSLLALAATVAMEKRLDFPVRLQQLFRSPVLETLAIDLQRSRRPDGIVWAWGSGTNNEQDAPTVFLIHGAGGEIGNFHDLAIELQNEYRVFGIQSPAAVHEQQVPQTLEALARRYRHEVSQRTLGPYVLIGWSMGGIVALEMGKKHDEGLRGIVLIDTHPPRAATARRSTADFKDVALALAKRRIDTAMASPERRFGSEPWDFGAGLADPYIAGLTERIRQDATLAATFVPGGVRCPIFMCEAEAGSLADRRGLLDAAGQFADIKRLGGDHFTILDEHNSGEIARVVSSIFKNQGL